jgi:hypothetical protein
VYTDVIQLFRNPPKDPEQLRLALRGLAAAGVDMLAPTDHSSRQTPLQMAAASSLGDVHSLELQQLSMVAVQELVAMGASLDFAHPKTGARAIHYAARTSKAPMIELLLELGADPNLLDDAGEAPIHACLARPDFDSGRLGVFCALLKGGANPTVRSPANKTLLQLVRGDEYKREVRSALLALRIQGGLSTPEDELKSSFRVTQRTSSGPDLL